MQLNPDCIRDILLTVEENTTFDKCIDLPSSEFPNLVSYTDDEILYHVRQLELSNLLFNVTFMMTGKYLIQDLMPAGHKFLADTREKETWTKTKAVASKLGTFSLNALEKISEGITAGLISGYFANQH